MEDPRERKKLTTMRLYVLCSWATPASISCYFLFFSNWGQMEDPRERKKPMDNAFVCIRYGDLNIVCNSHSNYCSTNSMNSTLANSPVILSAPMPNKQSMVLLHLTRPWSQRQSEIKGKSHTHKEPWRWHDMDKTKCHERKEKRSVRKANQRRRIATS